MDICNRPADLFEEIEDVKSYIAELECDRDSTKEKIYNSDLFIEEAMAERSRLVDRFREIEDEIRCIEEKKKWLEQLEAEEPVISDGKHEDGHCIRIMFRELSKVIHQLRSDRSRLGITDEDYREQYYRKKRKKILEYM